MNSTRVTLLILAAALWLCPASAEPFRAFGLTNTAIGDADITFQNGTMTVTSLGPSGVAPLGSELLPEGTFGVSIQLGDADAGLWVYPYHNGYVNDEHFLVGQVFGEVDGQSERPVCTVRARRESEGNHSVQADFSPIGATNQIFEVFNGDALWTRTTNAGGALIVHTYSQSGPRVNPAWRLPDGSIAAVIELSERESVSLPGLEDPTGYGNRIVIRPVNPGREVKFVSRVDVTGGGGLDHFLITEMRLGVFGHPHKALGPALLNAAGGKLEVANPDFGEVGPEFGVSIELERLDRFDLNLSPVELSTDGASIIASAVGSVNHVTGEFVGYAGLRNSNGLLQAFASLPALTPEMQIAIYRDGCLVGAGLAESSLAVVRLSGTPKAIGFGATAAAQDRAGLAITLNAATTFTLPDGTILEGDQIRFGAPNPLAVERLTAFNLVASGLAGFTLYAETTPQTISLRDYLVDLRPGASVKRFNDGRGGSFLRSVSATNRAGQALIELRDTDSNSVVIAGLFSMQRGDLFYHGQATSSSDRFSATGLRLLPDQARLGQPYVGAASFVAHFPAIGQALALDTISTTRVAAFETVTVPAGTFSALRVESTEANTLYVPGPGGVGTEHFVVLRTNWLVAGLGVVKFSVASQEGAVVSSVELADYNVITSQPRDQTVSVGANAVLSVSVKMRPDGSTGDIGFDWRRDGAAPSSGGDWTLRLLNVTPADAGHYSVTVSNAVGVVTSDVGSLKVIPFSDPACFWAQRAGGSVAGSGQATRGDAVAADAAGNVYVAGGFTGTAVFGAFTVHATGDSDLFVAKLSPGGQYLWAIRAGANDRESATQIGLDAAGNLYMAGEFEGTTTLGATTLISAGARDAFVAKLDANGNFLWAVRGGGTGYDFVTDLAVDPNGQLYVTGPFDGRAMFGDTVLTGGSYGSGLFVAKLDANGNYLWAKSVSSADPTALALEPGGDVYVAGGIFAQTAFGGFTLTPGRHNVSAFLARLDPNGNFLWAQQLGDGDYAHDVAVDAAGNVFVTGGFSGLATFGHITLSSGSGPYYPELFLAKLDAHGQFLWATKAPGASEYFSTRLAVDRPGNSYVFRRFFGVTEVGVATLDSQDTSLLLSKVNPRGHTVWAKPCGGLDYFRRAIATDLAGNVYLAGGFNQSARFGDFILTDAASSFYNLFVVKMCGPAPPVITTQPQSLTVDPGTNATFSVRAAGTAPLTYQWRENGVNIPGATSDNFTITNVQALDAGDYGVMVSSEGGSVSSALATLGVTSPYAGTFLFGAANFRVSEPGGLALIEVMRTGSLTGPVTVDFGTGNGTAWAELDYLATAGTLRFGDGESLKTLAVPILDDVLFEGDETVMLRLCQPKGGAVLGTLAVATLTITDDDSPAPVIIWQPRSRALVIGGSVAFGVTVSGQAPFHYQWRRNGANIAGANNSTYVIGSVQLSDAGNYSVVIVNDFGETISRNATLTLYPLLVIHRQPQSQTVGRGNDVIFTVIASGFNTATQSFTRSATGGMEDRLGIGTLGEAGRLVIDYDFFTLPDSLRIYRDGTRIFDTGLTNGSGTATVFYGSGYSSSGGAQVVVNEGGGGLPTTAWSYQLQVIPETLRYQWRKDGVVIPWGTGAALLLYSVNDSSAGQYTVTVSDRYGSVVSLPATLTVVPPAPPTLRVMRVAGTADIGLFWDSPRFYLEAAVEVDGPWYRLDAAAGLNSLVITPGDEHHFFRLREDYPPGSD